MPEAATVSTPPVPLEPFEGQEVIASTIAVTKAGDGLSTAIGIAPQAFHQGQRVYVLLECDTAKVRFSAVPDTESLRREHTFETQAATIVDASYASDVIERQKALIRKAKETAAGIEPLPFGDQPTPDVGPLQALNKDQLRRLADANAVTLTKNATKDRMIELLAEVPGINEIAATFKTVPDDSEASVTSLADRRDGMTDEEWEGPTA